MVRGGAERYLRGVGHSERLALPVGRSLFGHLVRYGAFKSSQPRENRLTEVVAAVLDRVDGLALDLVQSWLSDDRFSQGDPRVEAGQTLARLEDASGKVRVTTQRQTADGRFADMELTFEARDGTPVTIAVENKFGTGLHDDQVAHYERDLQGRGGTGAVVIVGPEWDLPFAGAEPRFPQCSWQAVGRRIRAFRMTDPVESWLLIEAEQFLREEGLMDPSVLNPQHFVALSAWGEAEEATNEILRRADEAVEARWGQKSNDGQPTLPRAWFAYEGLSEAVWGPHHWLDWNIRDDKDFAAQCRGALGKAWRFLLHGWRGVRQKAASRSH